MPVRSRALGLALVYTLGISLFAGTTQFAAAALIAWHGGPSHAGLTSWSWPALVGAAATFGLPDVADDPASQPPV